MIVNDSKKSPKVAKKYYCDLCDYESCKNFDYKKHLSTDKHKKQENGSKMVVNGSDLSQKVAIHSCNCGKIYKYDSGYYRHKKKCKYNDSDTNKNSKDELITYLVKENQEFKSLILEIVKKDTYNTTNNTNNSHNKTFNLQLFLNETCKDAMNIMDFVDSIKIQLSDLENVGKLGYVEGISNIIIKNLNDLDLEKRPVHCTDSKREVLYVKDDNQWYNDSKDQNENKKIRKAIKHITHKNSKLLPEFKAKYPDCIYSDSKKSDQYNKIIIESLNDSIENDNKIIKKIAKEVIIDK